VNLAAREVFGHASEAWGAATLRQKSKNWQSDMSMRSKRNGRSTQPAAGSAVEITGAELIVTLANGCKIVIRRAWAVCRHDGSRRWFSESGD